MSPWPTRRTYAALGAGFAAFAVYGSLVPLNFQPIPWAEAIERFSNVPYYSIGVASRADWVANILLFIPVAFLLTGALRADRHGRIGHVVATLLVVASCAALSVATEFTQIFFPPRTVSINDIVAESAGAVIGVLGWWLVGAPLTLWLRMLFRERHEPLLLVRLLTAYAVVFVGTQLMPLDVTIDLGELAQKYREGRIIPVPFGYTYPTWGAMVWDMGADVLLHVPLGMLAVLGWPPAGHRRGAVRAFAMSMGVVAAVEGAQLFIFSRYSDATDVLVGTLGAGVGIYVATLASAGPVAAVRRMQSACALWPLAGAAGWIGCLMLYHWYPFDFVLQAGFLKQSVEEFSFVPFRGYYYGPEFQAFTQFSRKLLLAVPLGVLLSLAWPASANRVIGRLRLAVLIGAAAAVFTAIEVGQLLLPGRWPDVADILIGIAGVALGLRVVPFVTRRSGVMRRSDRPDGRVANGHRARVGG